MLIQLVPITVNPRLRSRAGQTSGREIQLHPEVASDPKRCAETIAHEFAHCLAGVQHGHGRAWRRWTYHLGKLIGADAAHSRCHSYKLSTATKATVVAICTRCDAPIHRRKAIPLRSTLIHTRCGGRIKQADPKRQLLDEIIEDLK